MRLVKPYAFSLRSLTFGILFLLLSFNVLAQESIKLQLKWSHAFQFAGYYAALEQGYYQDAGLDVQIIEGRPGLSVIEEVTSGRADVGVGTSSVLLNQPITDIVLLANIFQHSPLVIVSLDQGPFYTVHNLVGKKLMLEDGSDELLAYLINEGISLDSITIVPHTFNTQSLLEGDVDAMSTYLTSEIYDFYRAGVDIRIFTPRSVGIDFYGDNLFTSRQFLNTRPDVIDAFTHASLKGWHYALNHIDETIALILSQYTLSSSLTPSLTPSLTKNSLKYEAESMLQLIRPDIVEIGYINPGRWQHIAEVYQNLGLLNTTPDWDAFFFKAADNSTSKWSKTLIIVLFWTLIVIAIASYIYYVNMRLRKLLIEQHLIHSLKTEHNQILALIADDQPLISILTAITLNVEKHRPGTLCSIMLKNDTLNCLVPAASPSLDADYLAAIQNVPIFEGMGSCGTAAATRKRVIVADIQTHPYWESVKEYAAKAGLKACWSQPVINHSGQVLATFAMYNREICEPNPSDIELIEEVARLAAIAIDRSRMLDLLRTSEQHHRHLAHHDPLTGIANRVLFSDRVSQAIRLATREKHHIALMLIDLNDFKVINDQYGHTIGDQLLCAISKRLESIVRSSDTLCRYGGDEFVVLLQSLTDQHEATIVEQKLYSAMQEPFTIDSYHIKSGCSIGIAYFPEDGIDETTLVNIADQRMYESKRLLKK